jgi:predicted SnoaL-like aldol condensation-catalyzing enzyme
MDTVKSNKKIVELFCETVFNNHDLSRLDDYMHDNYIQHNADVATGKAGFKDFFQITFKAIPDFKCSVKQIIAEGDLVAVYSKTSGTHVGHWIGPTATGNKLSYDVVDIFRVQDGKIAEHWDVADTFKLFMQVGAIEQKLARNI